MVGWRRRITLTQHCRSHWQCSRDVPGRRASIRKLLKEMDRLVHGAVTQRHPRVPTFGTQMSRNEPQ